MNQIKERDEGSYLSGEVLRCAFRVSNALGAGFLEKVYENALIMELRDSGIGVIQQPKVNVLYKGSVVGEYVADAIVDNRVVVEIKAVPCLNSQHESQALNYLRATGLKIALLLNFGRPRIEYRRIVWRL
ncbi:MAG TPA: GxxExxY protein [Usitatibacter sp.]|nr:GxxExxY protein [Usitatibacter sp.]